ncbi:MAG: hypothetical protein ACRDSZ_01575 [Pseudonocardiaceae bacterium]
MADVFEEHHTHLASLDHTPPGEQRVPRLLPTVEALLAAGDAATAGEYAELTVEGRRPPPLALLDLEARITSLLAITGWC